MSLGVYYFSQDKCSVLKMAVFNFSGKRTLNFIPTVTTLTLQSINYEVPSCKHYRAH